MPAVLTEQQKQSIREQVDAGVRRVRDICAATGVRHVAAKRYRDLYLAERAMTAAGEGVRSYEEDGDAARVECVVAADRVVTEDDLVRVGKIDLTRWRVRKMTVKAYQVGMKLAERESAPGGKPRVVAERPHVLQLFSVRADLERVLPRPYIDALDGLFDRLSRGAPRYERPAADAASPYLVQLGLFDAHFAKLCWHKESGDDYDLRIAEAVYRNAAEDLLRLIAPYPVGRFVLPLGNDFFHIDSNRNATTSGTVVDTDGRYAKMIEVGEAAVIRLIERLQSAAPVDVLYVPGNHDRLSSYHLCRAVAAWFRNAPGVAVDLSPSVRKYRRYGSVLFGWRHGDGMTDAQVPTLPGLMAVEAAADWGASATREWMLGHRHTSRRFVSRESDERHGVQIRYLSSLSGTDSWHHENAFVGNRKAAEAYLYDTDGPGYVGHFVAPARS